MLKSVQKWLFGRAVPDTWREVQTWCEQQGGHLRLTHDRDGFALTVNPAVAAVRVEWGPSQRAYLGGPELRLRAESGVDPAVYAVLMPRTLMDRLESELFSDITDGTKTRLDETTPEEVRWLAMSPRLTGAQLGVLAERWGAAGNAPQGLADWLRQSVSGALLAADAAREPGGDATPTLVWVAQRGRMTLRLQMPEPSVAGIAAAMALFEQGLAQAALLGAAPEGHSAWQAQSPGAGD